MTHWHCRRVRLLFVVGLLTLAQAGVVRGQQPAAPVPLSAADADRFGKKLAEMDHYGAQTASKKFRPDQTRRTAVTEAETNSYLRYKMASELPAGLVDPYIAALGGGRLSANGILDLDAVRRGAGSAKLELSRWLTGRVPVTVSGVLRTRAGIATFDLESASIAGIPMPKTLLQQLVYFYTRSPEYPDGFSLDSQFALPAGIREIDVQNRQAIIVQ
jgi:hypothetical protein